MAGRVPVVLDNGIIYHCQIIAFVPLYYSQYVQNVFRWAANDSLAVIHDNRALERTGMFTDFLEQRGAIQIIVDPLLLCLFSANDITGLQPKHIKNVGQFSRTRRIRQVFDDIRLNSLLLNQRQRLTRF